MTCAQLRTKTRTSISRKICCVRLGFQILYAVEQFSSLFLKDKYTKPMIRLPRACRGRTAVQISANSSHMCCVELALKVLASAERVFYTLTLTLGASEKQTKKHRFSPVTDRRLCHADAKQLSMAATARVIWLRACVR